MSNFVIEIKAPEIASAIQQLASVLAAPKIHPEIIPLPQTATEQAVRAQVVPAQPAAPILVQQYQPAVPVNPTPVPQQAAPVVPVAAAPTASTFPSVPTSAPPATPVTTYAAPTAMPVNPAPVAPVAAAPAFAMEDLARAASQLMDAGKQQDLLGLLAQFGVPALTQLPKERYGEFATALRQMGAKL